MNRSTLTITGLALLLALVPAAGAMQLLSEENPPFNFSQQDEARGLYVDVVTAIQTRLGEKDPIKFLPWPRAWRAALTTPNTALFSTARIKNREALFHWVGPVSTSTNNLYALSLDAHPLHSLTEARQQSAILVESGSYAEQLLKDQGFTNLMPAASPAQMVNMLLARRAPLLCLSDVALRQLLANLGMSRQNVTAVFRVAVVEGYIALSLPTPPAQVRQWQQALQQMKHDGSFVRIYRRWNPNGLMPGFTRNPAAWPALDNSPAISPSAASGG